MGSLWNRSGTVERYADDLRAAGAKAFFFNGGTTSPMTVFRDSGETSTFPNPVVADANGRWPDVFVPYTPSYDVQTKTADDVQLTFTQRIPNPNPVDITTTIPPEVQGQLVQVGTVVARFTTNAVLTGYVRCNGKTIGDDISGGSELASTNQCLELFKHLYDNIPDALAPVSGGRTGAGSAGDFALHKTIRLPDARGRVLAGADQMGSSEIGAYVGIVFDLGGGGDTSASTTGINSLTLTVANMPPHLHQGTSDFAGGHFHQISNSPSGQITTGSDSNSHTHALVGTGTATIIGSVNLDHTHQIDDSTFNPSVSTTAGPQTNTGGGVGTVSHGTSGSRLPGDFLSGYVLDHIHTIVLGGSTDGENVGHNHQFPFNFPSGIAIGDGNGLSTHTHTFTTDSKGNGVAFNNMPLSLLVNWFIKL